jgi:hypothetical protein
VGRGPTLPLPPQDASEVASFKAPMSVLPQALQTSRGRGPTSPPLKRLARPLWLLNLTEIWQLIANERFSMERSWSFKARPQNCETLAGAGEFYSLQCLCCTAAAASALRVALCLSLCTVLYICICMLCRSLCMCTYVHHTIKSKLDSDEAVDIFQYYLIGPFLLILNRRAIQCYRGSRKVAE